MNFKGSKNAYLLSGPTSAHFCISEMLVAVGRRNRRDGFSLLKLICSYLFRSSLKYGFNGSLDLFFFRSFPLIWMVEMSLLEFSVVTLRLLFKDHGV